MCGLAGFVDTTLSLDEASGQLGCMLARIAHRGPDNEGRWHDGAVAIGHRRLSIIDLSPLGHQPMVSATGRYIVTLNGEIYNHKELRTELQQEGQQFRGHSDTEVLLALIDRDGLPRALRRCVGMFAVALWDKQERVLQLARDRFGEKPLYYGWHQGSFLWGSELKALCAHHHFERRLDPIAVEMLLRYSYIPGPLCIFRQTYKLPPARILRLHIPAQVRRRLTPEDCSQHVESYWSVASITDTGMAQEFDGSNREAADQVEILIAEAIRLQMMSEVPLGAFLSGGVDSSLVVALMQRQSASPVQTFTIGFEDSTLDEAPTARAVATHLGTAHTEHYVSSDDALSVVPVLPEMFCEPMADPSQIPTYLLARLARKSITVSLSGDGGDEVFCGYTKYVAGLRLSQLPVQRMLARIVSAHPSSLFGQVSRYWSLTANSLLAYRRIAALRRRLGAKSNLSIAAELATMNGEHRTLMRRSSDGVLSLEQWYVSPKHEMPYLKTAMNLDLATYLPYDILTKVDMASMAVGLESRAPLLDHRVFEFAATLPAEFLFDGNRGKRVLRDVLYRYVPAALVDRPKAGFSPPLARWLRGSLYEWAADLLASASGPAVELLAMPVARTLLQRHSKSERIDLTFQLWPILTLLAWSRHHVEKAQ